LLTTSALIKISKAWRGRERRTLRICRSAEKHALTVHGDIRGQVDPEVSDLRYRKHCSVVDPNWSSRDLMYKLEEIGEVMQNVDV